MDYDVLWSKVLDLIKNEVSSLSFNTWFSETTLYNIYGDEKYVLVEFKGEQVFDVVF